MTIVFCNFTCQSIRVDKPYRTGYKYITHFYYKLNFCYYSSCIASKMKEFEQSDLSIQDIIRMCQCRTHNHIDKGWPHDYDLDCWLFKDIKRTVAHDCTDKCQSAQHGDHITATLTTRAISDPDLCSYLKYACHRCESVRDSLGRTALHIAASCGKTDVARWLIQCCEADVNVRDKESGSTALHRSIFYGKIDTAIELIKLGANTDLQDADGLTFLDHALLDRFHPQLTSNCGELFTWGANSNNSLGSQQPRDVPEIMNIFHKNYPNESVKMFLINQFHSVILTESGIVYSCGHGHGGRLGLGTKHTELVPRQLHFEGASNIVNNSEQIQVKSCSIARDHSLFLTTTGILYSCGLNKHKVLGIKPAPVEILVPQPLRHSFNDLLSVSTGDYHSLTWNKTGLFTWGLNAGQLGHHLKNPLEDKYILTPKRVKNIDFESNCIKLVRASTGATVIYTERGNIYVLHEYQCKKITSRQTNLVDMSVVGGKLNHNLDPELSDKNRELKVLVLTSTGILMLWQGADPVLCKCVFSIKRSLSVAQMTLTADQILFVTRNGEAYRGTIRTRRKKTAIVENVKNKSEFHKLVEKDDLLGVKVEKIPRIHRALSIYSDPKGQNFGVIQEPPYKSFDYYTFEDNLNTSNLLNDNFLNLLEEANPEDGVVDVQVNVEDKKFFAHQFILSSRSRFLANLLLKNNSGGMIELSKCNADIFEQLLHFIYGRTSDLTSGERSNAKLRWLCKKYLTQNKTNGKSTNPIRMLREMAERFEVGDLKELLNSTGLNLHLNPDKDEDGDGDKEEFCLTCRKNIKDVHLPVVKFDRRSFPEFSDVEIICSDEKILKAHKCVLVARSEYFRSMFSTRWMTDNNSKISFLFVKETVESLLEFLYTDNVERLHEKDLEQLCDLVRLADQTLTMKLQQRCENILAQLLTIKNTVALLTLAVMINAEKLKKNCYRFVQQNLASFLELRLLDDLEPKLLRELSEFYQAEQQIGYRDITPYSSAASKEEIRSISSERPMNIKKENKRGVKSKKEDSSRKSLTISHDTSSGVLLKGYSSPSALDNSAMSSIATPSNLNLGALSSSPASSDNAFKVRMRAITAANEKAKNEEISENYISLRKSDGGGSLSSSFVDEFEFPLLSSPPRTCGFQNKSATHKAETRHKTPKLSQKQRKRLSSESSNQGVGGSPTLAESPKNPWKIVQDPIQLLDVAGKENMESIISSEKKQKENLVKMKNKPLAFTQLEDKAMDELKRFYGVDNVEDEIITIERVPVGAVALPVWVPK